MRVSREFDGETDYVHIVLAHINDDDNLVLANVDLEIDSGGFDRRVLLEMTTEQLLALSRLRTSLVAACKHEEDHLLRLPGNMGNMLAQVFPELIDGQLEEEEDAGDAS